MSSNLKTLNTEEFRKSLVIFTKILDILEEFQHNYDRRLNFSRLVDVLRLPKSEMNEIIDLILAFQDKFTGIFANHQLRKVRINGDVYLLARKRKVKITTPPSTIILTKSQVEQFNDIIYTFRHVKRGQGFDIERNGSQVLSNIKKLEEVHPYLFIEKENRLIYPSQLGLELGDLIMSYNKGNRALENIAIGNYNISVINNG